MGRVSYLGPTKIIVKKIYKEDFKIKELFPFIEFQKIEKKSFFDVP